MKIDELPTPSLIIDLDAVERNIAKMQEFVRSRGCDVRPHAKPHKSPFIARKKMRAGAIGQCCQTLLEAETLMLSGIMGYEGHLQISTPAFEERKTGALRALGNVTKTIDALKERGITPEIVTCGGTGKYNITGGYPGVTEIQPGSYVCMDRRYGEIDTAGTDFEKAMTVVATVVSTPTPTRTVTDLGWKAVGIGYEALGLGGMPESLLPGLRCSPGGDEHGALTAEEPRYRPKVGDRVRFVPADCDTTPNLYGTYYGTRGDRVEVACSIARR